MLAAKGLITPLDEPSLTLACWLWQEYQQDMAIVAKEGRYSKGKPHPAMLQAQKAVKQLNELLKLFGMHPASRTRLGGAKEEPERDDSYSKFRRGVR
jgi:P27 family predicted phage terminase small subunit